MMTVLSKIWEQGFAGFGKRRLVGIWTVGPQLRELMCGVTVCRCVLDVEAFLGLLDLFLNKI
jgi:hypothetical protein